MIKKDTTSGKTLKQIREKEREGLEAILKEKCQKLADERYGADTMKKWSIEHRGLWFLPILDDDDNVEKLAVLKPINRHILSYASTKIADEGLYTFLEECMRECLVAGDAEILDDDEYFIPAAMKFNAILEGKKAALVKR
jgi:CRISPR/Cas system CSM-associated protein Csm2 small subunit